MYNFNLGALYTNYIDTVNSENSFYTDAILEIQIYTLHIVVQICLW